MSSALWRLARRQHGVVTWWQLRELGFSAEAIAHRIDKGRLHRVFRGVYAVGRRDLTQLGMWMAAVLACGEEAVLSHSDAAALFEIRRKRGRDIEVSVPAPTERGHPGIVAHRRKNLRPEDRGYFRGIPVTSPICTIVDIAPGITRDQLEAAVNEADIRRLTNPDKIRRALDQMPRRPGVAVVRATLDRRTFRFTRSRLERAFRPLARRAGLPPPLTRQTVNEFEVDFYWPDLGLVIETDGLAYHRTPAQQAADLVRDQAHAAADADLTPLRFSHAQIRYEPDYVVAILTKVAHRLRAEARRRHSPTP